MLQYLQLANKYKNQFNFRPYSIYKKSKQSKSILSAYCLCLCLCLYLLQEPYVVLRDDRSSVKRLIEGEAFAKALNRRLAVFPIIRRPCTDLTRPSACVPACLPTASVSGLIRGRSRPDQRLIDSNRSLWPFAGCTFEWQSSGVPPQEALIRFGDGPILKLWFNSIDQLIKSFVVFAGWSFERSW